MSQGALSYVLKLHTDLRATSKMVLVALADVHKADTGLSTITIKEIAHFACMDEKTAYRQILFLKKCGLIAVEKDGYKANSYILPGLKKKKPVVVSASMEEMFVVFWKLYPKGGSKHLALKRYYKINPADHLAAKINADIERRLAQEWLTLDRQYIPMAATYLNQRRWDDDPDTPPEAPTPIRRQRVFVQ